LAVYRKDKFWQHDNRFFSKKVGMETGLFITHGAAPFFPLGP